MDTLLGVMAGIGLSAACGFRVFVPLLVISLGALSGHLELSPGFHWLGSWPAVIAFSVATVIEIAAYYIPVVDNVIDTIASPAAVVAGTILTASCVTHLDPFMRWTLALIAGGGTAALVQGATVVGRAMLTGTTGGLGNHALATGELAGSVVTSSLAFIAPTLAGAFVMLLVPLGILALLLWKRRRSAGLSLRPDTE